MSSNTVISIAWIFHTIFFVSIGFDFIHAARERSGKLIQWPVGLRWIFAILFFLVSAIAVDTVLIRMIGGGFFGDPSTWKAAIIRVLPIPFEAWVLYRMKTNGLSLDLWEKTNGKY